MISSVLDASILTESVTFTFSGKTAPNRIIKAAMTERLCTYSEDEFARGEPTEELEKVYAIWGKGGLGVVHTGNIMIHHAHLEAEGCAIIDPEMLKSYVPAFTRLHRAATSQSPTAPLLIGQLAHVGGQVSSDLQKHPVVVAEGLQSGDQMPARWTPQGILGVVKRFAFAARFLKDAGFDGVQIHGAYGYIITQFLSCHSNTRTDEYGGSLSNRSRILLEIISAVKERVDDPAFVLGVKLNATDFLDGGLPAQEPRELARMLEEAEVDYIELSGGTYEGLTSDHKPNSRQAHFLLFANQVRSALTKTKMAVTGGFKTAESMVNAVRSGATDFVGLARSLTHEPMLASDILSGRASCAKPNKLPASLAVNLDAGISQIQRMGRGMELRDFSDQDVVDEWMKARGGS